MIRCPVAHAYVYISPFGCLIPYLDNKQGKKKKNQMTVVPQNLFLLCFFQGLIHNYATKLPCHFPLSLTSQGFDRPCVYMVERAENCQDCYSEQ